MPNEPTTPHENREQQDEDAQAQTVADEAIGRAADGFGLDDSEKAEGGITDEGDAQDLVDHMNQMERSGNIDMSAYRGEPNMDDNENAYGRRNKMEDEPENSDS